MHDTDMYACCTCLICISYMNHKKLRSLHLVSRHYHKVLVISPIGELLHEENALFSIPSCHYTLPPLQGFNLILWGLLMLYKNDMNILWYQKEPFLLLFFLLLIFFIVLISDLESFFFANVLRDIWNCIVFSLV